MDGLKLRDVRGEDLIDFYEHQMDPVARHMGAFLPPDGADWDAFSARWERIRADEAVTAQTIVVDGQVVGNIVSFEYLGRRQVGYWLGRDFWGRGIATAALRVFLQSPSACSISPALWAAEFITRMRALPCGTVG
jgi:RimJ/RimL family protein N-acetyltransferase